MKSAYNWNDAFENARCEYLLIDSINTDYSYQRALNPVVVNKIAKKWNWFKCSNLHICQRNDGSYWVVDGNTRLAAAKKAGIKAVRCIIIASPGREAESLIFVDLQDDRRKVSALGKYRALLLGENEIALRVQKILEKYNIVLNSSTKNSDTHTHAAYTLLEIAEKTDDHSLDLILAVCKEICEKSRISTWLILGLYELTKNPGFDFFTKDRINRLSKRGVRQLSRDADEMTRREGASTAIGARDALLDQANKGCTSTRINLRSSYENPPT